MSAVLNSETVRARSEQWQATGQFGARHFDKVAFNLPIPPYDPQDILHSQIANAGAEAERVAASVANLEGVKFRRARALIRAALERDGVRGRIETLVARLLDD